MLKLKGFAVFFLMAFSLVDPGMAADPYAKMAKELSRGISRLKNPRVAVLALPYHNGIENNGSAMVAERLITPLAQAKGFRLIERSLLRNLLEENALYESGVLDPDSVKQMGKILGVDVIVSGTLIDLSGTETEVNARVLDAQTGAVLTASRAIVPKTWSDSSILPRRRPPPAREEETEKHVPNEAIKIGIPASRPGFGAPRGRY